MSKGMRREKKKKYLFFLYNKLILLIYLSNTIFWYYKHLKNPSTFIFCLFDCEADMQNLERNFITSSRLRIAWNLT